VTETRVLVVDDEKFFIDLLAAHLKQNRYSVDTASSGEAALALLQTKGPYALLITDLNMPGMGGLELLRLARKHDPEMEVIVFTADDNVETAVAAMREYGAYDYLIKPLNLHTRLLNAVERAIEHRRLYQDREALKSEVIAHAGRLQALIASTEDAILSADPQNVITIINPATLQLFGRKPLVGNNALTTLPDPFAKLVRSWLEVLHSHSALVEVEWGPNAHYRVSLVPLNTSGDDLGGWVMVITDVSHFKRLEEFRLHLLHDAANRIQLPLFNALSTVAEMERLPDSQNSRTVKALLGLSRHLSQIRMWVDEVLVTARMDAGIGLQPDYLDVPQTVREWEENARSNLRDRDPRLLVSLTDSLPRLYIDRELFLRLLRQLMEQSRHTKQVDQQHQLALNFYEHKGQLWIDATLEGPTVRDTGTLRLSGLHTSPDQPLSDLALVVNLAGKLGGQVWIRSRRPAGSALSICLPAPTEPGSLT